MLVWNDGVLPVIDGPRHPIIDIERGRYFDTVVIAGHPMDRWRVQDEAGEDEYQINITQHCPTPELGYHVSIGYKVRRDQGDPTDREDLLAEEVFRHFGVTFMAFGRMGPQSNAANYVQDVWRKS